MRKLTLCISCLNGEWTAAGFRKGAPAGLWHSPTPVDDFASAGQTFRDSVLQTGSDGKMVGLVLAHPRLTDQVVDVPPIKGSKLARFLDRRVQQLKTFEGDVAWSHQRALPAKGTDAALVHLFPKAMLEQLGAACREAGGQLVRVIPITTVLATQLKELPIEKEELALIAAVTGNSTTIIIGKRDGRVCLGRILRGTWAGQADRVSVDLMRTIGFAEQQTGLTVNSVWLFGAGAAERQAEMQMHLRPAVKVSPVEYTEYYWASQAARLSPKEDGNLVAPEVREAPQRRRRLTLTGVSLLAMLAASMGAAGYVAKMLQDDQEQVKAFDAEILRWQNSRDAWQARHAGEARKRQLVQLIAESKVQPLPGWLLGYLSEATPADLLLNRLEVQRSNDVWSVRITGTAQPSTNDVAIALQPVVSQFVSNLTAGPFRMRMTHDSLAAKKPEPPAQAGAVPPSATFSLEGQIR
jgi:hypothetical protein